MELNHPPFSVRKVAENREWVPRLLWDDEPWSAYRTLFMSWEDDIKWNFTLHWLLPRNYFNFNYSKQSSKAGIFIQRVSIYGLLNNTTLFYFWKCALNQPSLCRWGFAWVNVLIICIVQVPVSMVSYSQVHRLTALGLWFSQSKELSAILSRNLLYFSSSKCHLKLWIGHFISWVHVIWRWVDLTFCPHNIYIQLCNLEKSHKHCIPQI